MKEWFFKKTVDDNYEHIIIIIIIIIQQGNQTNTQIHYPYRCVRVSIRHCELLVMRKFHHQMDKKIDR